MLTFDFVVADWNLQKLKEVDRVELEKGINIVDKGYYYELVTKVGNVRYEHFIIPKGHIYATIYRYTAALLRNNTTKYGMTVKLVSFNEMSNSNLPTIYYKVGGNY